MIFQLPLYLLSECVYTFGLSPSCVVVEFPLNLKYYTSIAVWHWIEVFFFYTNKHFQNCVYKTKSAYDIHWTINWFKKKSVVDVRPAIYHNLN